MSAAPTKSARLPSVARYEFGEAIGAGGWGTVYRALDRTTAQEVAIKVLRVGLAENPTQHRRAGRDRSKAKGSAGGAEAERDEERIGWYRKHR